ncbi:CDP-alcohol phosphatidyltransferase family protein [Desulfurispira natronophila]|uniref:Phosphatidylglycerophosphate synthase n=1 Tax=Desulfurispira natronophila TaxID=682562 RepID=A0A7W8DHY6_9BACT|nr:CDP-alcohol phosphatidyltransferase family protein [Desulfurispira natronophila]MBB5022847.1 phosphatidylglycerophosphate synthase [Desulfurispira natronophila]
MNCDLNKDSFKQKSTGLPYTVYINRVLARWLVIWVCRRGFDISPNQVTVMGFLLFLCALPMLLLFVGTYWVIVPYVILFSSYVLDSMDGLLARARGMCSGFGEWLDHSLDGVRFLLIHVTLLWVIIIYAFDESKFIALLAFTLCIVFVPGNYFCSMLKNKILHKQTGRVLRSQKGFKGFAMSAFAAPADYGIFIVTLLLLAQIDLFVWAYLAYGVHAMLIFGATVWFTVRSAHEGENV